MQLTHNDVPDAEPARSPDGTRIVFTRTEIGLPRTDIYVMNPDGSNEVNLSPTTSWTQDDSPDWSPDATRIAFMNRGGRGGYGIYLMNSDGTGAGLFRAATDHPRVLAGRRMDLVQRRLLPRLRRQ
jgi:Tol biopolymer transport system component